MHTTTHEKEWFVSCLNNDRLVTQLKKISLVISDVDGCLTDGTKAWHCDNSTSKCFSLIDGMLMRAAQDAGISVALISGDRSSITKNRATQLGIPDDLCHLVHWTKKVPALERVQQHTCATPQTTLLFGDDLPDLTLRPYANLFACPSDAVWYIAEQADLISPRNGGRGALRSLLDLILFVQNKHPEQATIAACLR